MNMSAQNAVVLGPGEGNVYSVLGTTLLVKTSGDQSNGQWFVTEITTPPKSSGPPPHVHRVTTEIFIVLEGTMTFQIADQTQTVGAGGYAFVPPGTIHTFANETDSPVRYLGVASPATLEGYLRKLRDWVESGNWPPQDMREIDALMEKYDTFPQELP